MLSFCAVRAWYYTSICCFQQCRYLLSGLGKRHLLLDAACNARFCFMLKRAAAKQHARMQRQRQTRVMWLAKHLVRAMDCLRVLQQHYSCCCEQLQLLQLGSASSNMSLVEQAFVRGTKQPVHIYVCLCVQASASTHAFRAINQNVKRDAAVVSSQCFAVALLQLHVFFCTCRQQCKRRLLSLRFAGLEQTIFLLFI